MIYQFYVERDSLLHSLDPRVKIIGMLIGITSLMLFNDPKVLIPLFLLILLSGRLLGRLGIGEQLRLLKPLLFIVALTVVIWPLVYKPRLTGLLLGVSFSLRLLGFGLITFQLLMTTRQRELILGFVRLGLPYELGLTLTIALRYIPTLYGIAGTIMDAQRSRGLELDRGNLLERIRKTIPILIPLIVASLKTAHELSIALESRAFGASRRRTFYQDIAMKGRDYLALGILLVCFASLLYLRFALGFGHVVIYR
ncbi:energy-coupling factor transporter transmembrane component T family protein [Thermococcus nautili]|uniref:ABC-type cobalt transport system, permease component CbiQ-related transporters n=1 Tax=Thermococcus nautili TaxID=195522 RepID=W8PJR6_9EURY|nr:energy-coupling factor transporter transmembrane component T [Thermococcus nautili]AHL22329.1 ABC-type cobalt transport system, permease component CbiQ-related transporters [Thermococcus nautili]